MKSYLLVGIVGATALSVAQDGMAIIRHPDALEISNGNPAGPSQWFAKWGGNANGIAIGPHQVLTTRHQSGGVGTTVQFTSGANTGTYTVTSQTLIGGANTDLRVVTLNGPALTTYAPLYSGSVVGQTALIGGFGPQYTTPNYVNGSGQLIGYGVTNTAGNGNSLLFGQNRIDSTNTASSPWGTTPLLVADFDGADNVSPPGIAPAATSKVDFEAALGDGDSGGGWFIDVGGTPYLVGLSHGAALNRVNGSTINPYVGGTGSPAFFFGNAIVAVDLRSFTSQINAAIPEPASLGLLAAAATGLLRRRRA